jgi:thiamine pyrophosphokinase
MARIVIFANGVFSQPGLLRAHLRPDDRIFCADGGARHALALGLTPEAIIGDLDSLAAELIMELEKAGVTIHRHPVDKDRTDLELTLELAVAEQPDEIVLVTALGGRLDQMLANIMLLTRPEYAPVKLSLVDGPQWATLLRSHQATSIMGRPGDTLSLIPLTPTVTQVTLTGVKWPLRQATLSLGSTWSISNELAGQSAGVRIGEGLVLVVRIEPTMGMSF